MSDESYNHVSGGGSESDVENIENIENDVENDSVSEELGEDNEEQDDEVVDVHNEDMFMGPEDAEDTINSISDGALHPGTHQNVEDPQPENINDDANTTDINNDADNNVKDEDLNEDIDWKLDPDDNDDLEDAEDVDPNSQHMLRKELQKQYQEQYHHLQNIEQEMQTLEFPGIGKWVKLVVQNIVFQNGPYSLLTLKSCLENHIQKMTPTSGSDVAEIPWSFVEVEDATRVANKIVELYLHNVLISVRAVQQLHTLLDLSIRKWKNILQTMMYVEDKLQQDVLTLKEQFKNEIFENIDCMNQHLGVPSFMTTVELRHQDQKELQLKLLRKQASDLIANIDRWSHEKIIAMQNGRLDLADLLHTQIKEAVSQVSRLSGIRQYIWTTNPSIPVLHKIHGNDIEKDVLDMKVDMGMNQGTKPPIDAHKMETAASMMDKFQKCIIPGIHATKDMVQQEMVSYSDRCLTSLETFIIMKANQEFKTTTDTLFRQLCHDIDLIVGVMEMERAIVSKELKLFESQFQSIVLKNNQLAAGVVDEVMDRLQLHRVQGHKLLREMYMPFLSLTV